MSFSKEWEDIYNKQNHLSIWPWSDVVSYVKRYANPADNVNYRVLELGCGAGANIPFFESLSVEYHAIEGSSTIVGKLHEKFPRYKESIKVGDFTEITFNENYYDLVLDRGSLTCNSTDAIDRTLKNIHKALKSDGKFIGIDWFSTLHSEFGEGIFLNEDVNTKSNILKGHLAGLGNIHFSDKNHLLDLFSDYQFEILEHKINDVLVPNNNRIATWNLVVKK